MIALILTNHRSSFMEITVLKTSISHHHKIFSILKNILLLRDHPKLIAIKIWNTTIKTCSIATRNLSIRMPEFLWKSFKTLYNYLLLWKWELLVTVESVTKSLMTRSKLRNKYSKNRTQNCAPFKKQRNYYVKIQRYVKKEYLSNLNIKNGTDNMKFWSIQ